MRLPDLGTKLAADGHAGREVTILPLDAPFQAISYGPFSEVTCFFNGEDQRYCVTLRCKNSARAALEKAIRLRTFQGRIGPAETGDGGETYRVIVGRFIYARLPA